MTTMTTATATTINSHLGSRLAVLAQRVGQQGGFLLYASNSEDTSGSRCRTARTLLAQRVGQQGGFLLYASNSENASCSTCHTARTWMGDGELDLDEVWLNTDMAGLENARLSIIVVRLWLRRLYPPQRSPKGPPKVLQRSPKDPPKVPQTSLKGPPKVPQRTPKVPQRSLKGPPKFPWEHPRDPTQQREHPRDQHLLNGLCILLLLCIVKYVLIHRLDK